MVSEYDFEKLDREARERLASGGDIEDVLAAVRSLGASPVASMQVLRDVLGITVNEAKVIVLDSETWADQRGPILALHRELERARVSR